MDNMVLVIAAAVAVVVAVGATVAAVRAGARARRAAGMVAQLLEPDVVEARPDLPAAFPSSATLAGSVGDAVGAPGHGGGVPPAPDVSYARDDAGSVRIPVFDLARLRGWMTDGDRRLGSIAVISIEIDEPADAAAQLGADAPASVVDALTDRLRGLTRPRDVVAHVNPARFVLVCRDVPDADVARAVAERIAIGISHPIVMASGVAEIGASIGVAVSHQPSERPEQVLKRAVLAGNRARDVGGHRVECSDEHDDAPVVTGADLAGALARAEFAVHFLPLVHCATGRVAGFEALVRWHHPTRGLLLPADFLDDAERTGAIVPLGAWVLEEACRQTVAWQAAADPTVAAHGVSKIDVNLSALEFSDPGLVARVEETLRRSGLPPGALWLEVTEATVARDRAAAARTLGRLRDLGVGLVVDDYGTGTQSLESLGSLPIDAVKIDHAFVAGLGAGRDSDEICVAILELARSQQLATIAEGVETPEQFAVLRELGCEMAQGRFFAEPLPASELGDVPVGYLGDTGVVEGR